jgi:hypothetical protein
MPNRKTDGLSPFAAPSRVTFGHVGSAAARMREGTSDDRSAVLPRVSGDECASALERCGLVRSDEGAGVVWMEAGGTFVCVPRCTSLPAETLAEILSTSGLSMGDFIKQLDRRRPACDRMN